MKKSAKTINNRTIAIVRVSTAEQATEDRYSIPHQRTHIAQECKSRNLDLVHFFEFVQSGAKVLSNTSKERAKVIKFIQDFGISVVIVHELDRLARSMLDTLLFVDQLDKLGVAFISIHDGFDTTTAQGQLQMHILSAFSEYFRKQLASKVIGGMLERAKQGKPMGRRPLGYNIGNNGFEINEEEASIVRMIFTMFLEQNMGLRAISDHLNSMGLKSLRGNTWSHVSVKEVISNEIYTGTFTWADIRVENNHPAIIEPTTWRKVQDRRKRKSDVGGRAQNSFFLLSGLLRCGVCNNATMVGRTAHKGKYTYRYYTCNNYASRGTGTCDQQYVRADELEEAVLNHIQGEVSEEITAVSSEEIPANIGLLKEELALKYKELEKLKLMTIRAAEAYERGDYDLDFFSERKASIAEQKEDIEKDITRLKVQIEGQITPEEIAARIEQRKKIAAALIGETDPIKAKALLQTIIDHILVGKDKVIISYLS
jgi:site-specific DNA recombinase